MRRGWLVIGAVMALQPFAGAVLRAQAIPAPSTSADARLLEAIDWYTGVAGRVDDDRARSLLLSASEDGSDALARMWIARVHAGVACASIGTRRGH